MNEEAQKKLYLWGLITLAVIGVLFILWATFLNKGTLTVNGSAPFIVNVSGVKTESCSESPCSLTLAPGDYAISFQKAGYRTVERDINIPLGEKVEEVTFQFIPVFSKRGIEADLQLFTKPVLSIPELEDTPIFAEENYATYLAFDPESKRQTLYILGLADDELSEPRVATSFIRTIDDYTIIPGIEDQNRIALIERTEEESSLYMIDLTEKSRDNILTLPYMEDLQWIKGSNNFLLEAREEGEENSSIYLYDAEAKEAKKLDLKTSVDNVAVLDDGRFIAATTQSFTGAGASERLGGQLITLGEIPATPNVSSDLLGPQVSFIEYTLSNNTARLIALETSISSTDALQLETDGKTLLFLTNGEVYELKFEE